MPANFKGILVGVNDLRCDFDSDYPDGGYCWIIKKKDWDNGCNVCTDKIYRHYKIIKDFNIYFYVYKTKSSDPAPDSDKFRDKIFGFADVVNVEKNMYNKYYNHQVKIDNIRLFTHKIKLDDIKNQLEYWNDWSDNLFERFGLSLTQQGLLVTKNDCEHLQSFEFKNID